MIAWTSRLEALCTYPTIPSTPEAILLTVEA